MGDLVLSPAFDSVDIEVERGVILEELGEANDNPDDLVHEMFVRSFWRSHPLGAPILGSAETVRSIGLADLYRYYRSRYTPGNLSPSALATSGSGSACRRSRSSSRDARPGSRRRAPGPSARRVRAATRTSS